MSLKQLFTGKSLLENQNERLALEIIADLRKYIDYEKMPKEFVTDAINNAFKKLKEKNEKYEHFAELIIGLLQEEYPKHGFKI